MKKAFSLLLALLMILGMTACSGESSSPGDGSSSGTEQSPAGGNSKDSKEIVVSFATQWLSEEGRADFILEAARIFEEENPGYKFEGVPIAYSDFNDNLRRKILAINLKASPSHTPISTTK